MSWVLNTTKDYHLNSLSSLGWELTVCNALYPAGSPVRKLLAVNDSYGHLLYDYLGRFAPMAEIQRVLEIGGGYGYLMRDFLGRRATLDATMLDISPFLMEKQKETLRGFHVSYRRQDFLETDPGDLNGFGLAIMNENLGDFPTLLDIPSPLVRGESSESDASTVRKVLHYFNTYNFVRPDGQSFNLNIGAIEAIEKLCRAEIPYIFLGEHSCEARVPATLCSLVRIESTGNPERIRLKGHDEYTIKFSYLENVARYFGYRALRGPFVDFIPIDLTAEVRSILAAPSIHGDRGEIICHFVEDLYKYEYLFLIRE